MKSLVRGEETGNFKTPRVLVLVRGGVAEICADKNVDVFVIDYDNKPEAEIPHKYSDLIQA